MLDLRSSAGCCAEQGSDPDSFLSGSAAVIMGTTAAAAEASATQPVRQASASMAMADDGTAKLVWTTCSYAYYCMVMAICGPFWICLGVFPLTQAPKAGIFLVS